MSAAALAPRDYVHTVTPNDLTIQAVLMSTNFRLVITRDPSGYDRSDAQVICKHRECPLYKAPPCFTRCLEELLNSRSCYGTSFPDWKQFTRHFKINIPVGERGVVVYWVHGHLDKDKHTIQRVLDFAYNEKHSPLLHKFEELIEGEQTSYIGLLYTPTEEVSGYLKSELSRGVKLMLKMDLFGGVNYYYERFTAIGRLIQKLQIKMLV